VYCEVLINGKSIGTFGHDTVRNMGLSIGVSLGGQDVFVSGVCEEQGQLFFYDWIQHAIEAEDKVEFRRVQSGPSQPPRRKRQMDAPDAQQIAARDRAKRGA
jgi:hypothetical protein